VSEINSILVEFALPAEWTAADTQALADVIGRVLERDGPVSPGMSHIVAEHTGTVTTKGQLQVWTVLRLINKETQCVTS